MKEYMVEIEEAYNEQRTVWIKAMSLKEFIEKYRQLISKEEKKNDIGQKNESRIYIYLAPDKISRERDLAKIILGLGPIFEIGLENHSPLEDDGRHILNYRRLKEKTSPCQNSIRITLGDSNTKEVNLAAIVLYYYLIGEERIRQKLGPVFSKMTEEIAKSGYNSAAYNGLEGYYFSRYFIKWFLDFKTILVDENLYEKEIFDPLYNLLENLNTPYMEKKAIEKNIQ